jgi:hypothetical protein
MKFIIFFLFSLITFFLYGQNDDIRWKSCSHYKNIKNIDSKLDSEETNLRLQRWNSLLPRLGATYSQNDFTSADASRLRVGLNLLNFDLIDFIQQKKIIDKQTDLMNLKSHKDAMVAESDYAALYNELIYRLELREYLNPSFDKLFKKKIQSFKSTNRSEMKIINKLTHLEQVKNSNDTRINDLSSFFSDCMPKLNANDFNHKLINNLKYEELLNKAKQKMNMNTEGKICQVKQEYDVLRKENDSRLIKPVLFGSASRVYADKLADYNELKFGIGFNLDLRGFTKQVSLDSCQFDTLISQKNQNRMINDFMSEYNNIEKYIENYQQLKKMWPTTFNYAQKNEISLVEFAEYLQDIDENLQKITSIKSAIEVISTNE